MARVKRLLALIGGFLISISGQTAVSPTESSAGTDKEDRLGNTTLPQSVSPHVTADRVRVIQVKEKGDIEKGKSSLKVEESGNEMLEVDNAIHFQNPKGDDVVLNPGTYQLKAAEGAIQATPVGAEEKEPVLITAIASTHDEKISAPKVVSVPGEGEDESRLVLLMAGGKSLEAVGSYSGARPRALFRPTTAGRIGSILRQPTFFNAGVHVNSGPTTHSNVPGHANFTKTLTDSRLTSRPLSGTQVKQLQNRLTIPLRSGVHVNSGPTTHSNVPGHANFTKTMSPGAKISSTQLLELQHRLALGSGGIAGAHVNSGPTTHSNVPGHANFTKSGLPSKPGMPGMR